MVVQCVAGSLCGFCVGGCECVAIWGLDGGCGMDVEGV